VVQAKRATLLSSALSLPLTAADHPMASPSVSGLLSETEQTVPPVDSGVSPKPVPRHSHFPLSSSSSVDSKDSILLPDGSRIVRPHFEPNRQLFQRLPRTCLPLAHSVALDIPPTANLPSHLQQRIYSSPMELPITSQCSSLPPSTPSYHLQELP
jgi:hypothetical protein